MATPANNEDRDLRQRISDLLDRVLVRAENGYAVQDELSKMASASRSAHLTKLFARAQGSVGLVNSSKEGSPDRVQAFAVVTALKLELRAGGLDI